MTYDGYAGWGSYNGNPLATAAIWAARQAQGFLTGLITTLGIPGLSGAKVDYGLIQYDTRFKHVWSVRCTPNGLEWRDHVYEQVNWRVRAQVKFLNFMGWSAKTYTRWFVHHGYQTVADWGYEGV